jgi:Tol biopolymer transport system component
MCRASCDYQLEIVRCWAGTSRKFAPRVIKDLQRLAARRFWAAPNWSPDGKYLAYTDRPLDQQTETLFLLAVDNPEDKRPLTASAGQVGDYYARFSPDGQTLAFVRGISGGGGDLFLVRSAGGEPKRLTFDKARIHALDWTPDGAHIVICSDRLGGFCRLWKVPASGGQPELLLLGQQNAMDPSISRDWRRLAYLHEDRNINIWRYEVPRTTGQKMPRTRLIAAAGDNWIPQFSRDGKKIVFASTRSGSTEFWVCDSNGSNSRRLTFFNGPHVGSSSWSPDSQEIAFHAFPEGHAAVYVVGAQVGRLRRLTTSTSNETAPSWSRDGKWIYFVSDNTGALQVWKIPAEGGQAVQVTKKGGLAAPVESPDGKTIYYTTKR